VLYNKDICILSFGADNFACKQQRSPSDVGELVISPLAGNMIFDEVFTVTVEFSPPQTDPTGSVQSSSNQRR